MQSKAPALQWAHIQRANFVHISVNRISKAQLHKLNQLLTIDEFFFWTFKQFCDDENLQHLEPVMDTFEVQVVQHRLVQEVVLNKRLVLAEAVDMLVDRHRLNGNGPPQSSNLS